jgi:hypothetical protein
VWSGGRVKRMGFRRVKKIQRSKRERASGINKSHCVGGEVETAVGRRQNMKRLQFHLEYGCILLRGVPGLLLSTARTRRHLLSVQLLAAVSSSGL